MSAHSAYSSHWPREFSLEIPLLSFVRAKRRGGRARKPLNSKIRNGFPANSCELIVYRRQLLTSVRCLNEPGRLGNLLLNGKGSNLVAHRNPRGKQAHYAIVSLQPEKYFAATYIFQARSLRALLIDSESSVHYIPIIAAGIIIIAGPRFAVLDLRSTDTTISSFVCVKFLRRPI